MAPRRTDIILGVAVAVALSLIIALAQTDADAAIRPLSFVFAAGFGAILLLRGSMPRTVAVLSVLGTFAYYSLDLTPIGVALPVVAALYSLAEVGLTRFAIISGIIVVVVDTAFRIRDDSLPLGRLLGAESLSTIALLAAAVALGYAVATHRRFVAGQTEVLRLQDERLTHQADVRRQRERVEISRDLHDTIGHRLSVLSLHANVGIEALESGGDAVATHAPRADEVRQRDASEALERVRTEAAASLTELRSMVKLLRTEGEDTTMALDLGGIDVLLQRARTAGLRVDSRIDVKTGEVPAPVETVIVRIIQEGITNVLRHARAGAVDVAVSVNGNDVLVTVVDDGDGVGDGVGVGDGDGGNGDGREPQSRGYGLPGMRERVRLMGGRLTTSARPGQGFRLEARVPRRLPE